MNLTPNNNIIEAIDINDIIVHGKNKYNSNNHNIDSAMTLSEYEHIISLTNTSWWIDDFKNHYHIINLVIPGWLREASLIGLLTGSFSKLFQDELDDYVIQYKALDKLLEKGYFIRTDKVSLKYGMHGPGPYYNLKQVIESLASSRKGHQCIDSDTKKIKLYLIDWVNINPDKEFRVFVYSNNITAISQQNLYQTNNTLINKPINEQLLIINNWIKIITEYFENYIKPNIKHINNYTIDFAILDNDKPYFIELNSFGKELAAGSACFHWLIDETKLYNKSNLIYFRYVKY
jgi:hypothetical protein